jgi:hypothetical protein
MLEDFYHTGKIQRLRPGLNPRTRVPGANILTAGPSSYVIRTPNEILFERPNRKDKIGWARGTPGEKKCFYRVLVGKHEGKRIFWSYSNRWGGNIIMDLKEIG